MDFNVYINMCIYIIYFQSTSGSSPAHEPMFPTLRCTEDNHASHDYASGPDQRPSESAAKIPAGMHSTWGDGSLVGWVDELLILAMVIPPSIGNPYFMGI